MPMTNSTSCGVNLTHSKIRRACGDCCLRRYRVDPTWGIPVGTPPLSFDATTGMVRPWSSYTTLATAMDNFVGFSYEWFPPGEDHLVWVVTCGWVEMELDTPATVMTGDKFIGVDEGAISDSLVTAETLQVAGIFTAVESCFCQADWVHRVNCPAAPPAANNTSPATIGDQAVQKTVLLQFGGCCEPYTAAVLN